MIKLNNQLINRFFGDMDNACLEQVKHLVEQGAVVDPLNGEIVLNNIRTGIFSDYFEFAFYLDEDACPHQMGDERLVIASRRNPYYGYGDYWQYICVEKTSSKLYWRDYAQAWDPNSQSCYGPECRVYQLRIETSAGEWEVFPIWFEYRESAIIPLNN